MSAATTLSQLTLNDLMPGQSGQVSAIEGYCTQTQRLLAMGLLPGTYVTVERQAPLCDPISLRLPGCVVSIRRCDAARISIEPDAATA